MSIYNAIYRKPDPRLCGLRVYVGSAQFSVLLQEASVDMELVE